MTRPEAATTAADPYHGRMSERRSTGPIGALAFIIVAALTLAILLIGWRGLALLVHRRTRPRLEAGAR